MFRPVLRALIAALVVLLSVSLLSPAAQAGPKQPMPQGGSDGKTVYKVTTQGNVGEKMTVTSKALHKAGKKGSRHLDWRKLKKYFGKHTTWRDDFSAGYQAAGGTLDHASKSTKKRLKDRWTYLGLDPARAASRPMMPEAPGTNCTGVTKEVKWDGNRSESWFNSCDTNVILARWAGCTGVMGWITARVKGWYQAVPSAFGLICGQKALAVQTAKANSNVGAIKYYNYRIERLNSKVEGDYYIRSTLYPQ